MGTLDVLSEKAIQFRYRASEELSSLFQDLRLMCNDAIRIALKEKPRSRFTLIELAYPRLKEYGIHSHYILSACEVAYSVYRNKNRRSDPIIRKAFLKLDNKAYTLNHLLFRIPSKLTESTLSIAFSRDFVKIELHGQIGIDVDERNVTASDTSGATHLRYVGNRRTEGAIQSGQGEDCKTDLQGCQSQEEAP